MHSIVAGCRGQAAAKPLNEFQDAIGEGLAAAMPLNKFPDAISEGFVSSFFSALLTPKILPSFQRSSGDRGVMALQLNF